MYINYPVPTPVFPTLPTLAWSVHKRPIMSSLVTISAIGRETQLTRTVFPRWAFTLTYGGNSWLREETQNIVPDPTMRGLFEWEQISGLYIQCKGAYGEFYFSDPEDNSRANQWIATADGATLSYPVLYNWGTTDVNFVPYFPVGGLARLDRVFIDGVQQNPATYGIDPSNNVNILFASPPAAGRVITADFHFYYRCHFTEDKMDFSQFAHNLWEAKTVSFESVKP